MEKTIYAGFAYLGVGVAWLFVMEKFLPAPASGNLSYPIPLGQATGSVVIWPWSMLNYLLSVAQQGTQAIPASTNNNNASPS